MASRATFIERLMHMVCDDANRDNIYWVDDVSEMSKVRHCTTKLTSVFWCLGSVGLSIDS
jgi:hypothetical protein